MPVAQPNDGDSENHRLAKAREQDLAFQRAMRAAGYVNSTNTTPGTSDPRPVAPAGQGVGAAGNLVYPGVYTLGPNR